MSGQGVFSPGTPDVRWGSSFSKFIADQAEHRQQIIYRISTSPAQEQAMRRALDAAQNKRLPNLKEHPIDAYKDNCSTRVRDALKAGGQDVGNVHTPGQLARALERKANEGAAQKQFVDARPPPSIPNRVKNFDPKKLPPAPPVLPK